MSESNRRDSTGRENVNESSTTDDRRSIKLPVTAEVGGEGGSYADPTMQVPTFEGDIARGRGDGGDASVANQSNRMEPIAQGGIGEAPGPDSGMLRYPTEPPASESAGAGRSTRPGWQRGLMGAAAGAALLIGVQRFTRGGKTRRDP